MLIIRKWSNCKQSGGVTEGSKTDLPFYANEFDIDKDGDCELFFFFLFVH